MCEDEKAVTVLLCSLMSLAPDGEIIMVIGGKVVGCCGYMRALCGVGKSKVTAARKLVLCGSDMSVHGNEGSKYKTQREVYGNSVLFWRMFFGQYCSTNPAGGRYWPANKTYKDIYRVYS